MNRPDDTTDLSPLLDRIGRRLGNAVAHAEFNAWVVEQNVAQLQAELEGTRRLLEQANARIAELEAVDESG